MKTSPRVTAAVSVCVILAVTASSRGEDDSRARKMAEAIAKMTAVKYFTQQTFEFSDSTGKGEAKALKPEEHVKVSINEFRLFGNHVVLSLVVNARFEFKGEAKIDEKTVSIKGKTDVVHSISVRADFRVEDNKLIVSPQVYRLEVEAKLLELDPPDLANAEQMIRSVITKSKDTFLKDINDWLAKHQIGG